ncbi:ATP-binding protein [Halalkalibacter urbisdiaboli]|uniref:ATP-binding protein n=1 Tax=Halalkalibacter urbisdiaboli TaxID=1960589 RepID=UPI0013FD5DBB|nr:ATP-binding protein [Halalkalibacter urbisdiaboli]
MLQSNGKQEEGGKKKEHTTSNRLVSISQIAAGIAHEVKNPLTSVKGFLQLLKEESPHRYIDVAFSELENALTTMENLLHVSKPDLKDEPIVKINLCTELESILYLFQDQTYRVKVKKKFRDTDTVIYGKRNLLKKAFFNLLKNAFEAIPDKGEIIVTYQLHDEKLAVTISDTGVGIPEEKINLLGTPFFTSKSEGTGMGLTQVFSTIYDHSGEIEVTSELGQGTTFQIYFPVQLKTIERVNYMDLSYIENQTFSEFFTNNKQEFDNLLYIQGKELLESLKESNQVDDKLIMESTNTIISLLNEQNEYGLTMHAKEQGRIWAQHDLELILILDWLQLLRKAYWDILFNYYQHIELNKEEFFELERNINYYLDTFLKHFSSSFHEYKNELLMSQRELINELSVPVIPLTDTMAILPIVGTIDTMRAKQIQENVLMQTYELKLKHIIIDLSGVPYMDTAVVGHIFKIINGISIQGCNSTITGIRPEITNAMVELGIELHKKVETMGTLQQAIEEYTQRVSAKL